MKDRVLFLLLTLATARLMDAQAITGSIVGSVRDASGLGIVGAKVELVHPATGAERTVETNELGDFVVSSVDPGQYRLSVQASGFKTLERTDITLTASERLSLGTLTLEIGAVQERVTVA